MTKSRLQQTIDDYRSRLAQHESQAVATLETAYQRVLAGIQPKLDKLYEQISEKLDADEEVPISWLYERIRLENLALFIQHHVDQYGALALMSTRQMQHLAIDLGIRAATDLLGVQLPINIVGAFGVPSQAAIANLVGATQGGPLADLFAGFGTEAAERVKETLVLGVSLGQNPRAIAPIVRAGLGIARSRALTIARTEMIRAYRNANLETMRANSDICGKYRWTCALSARTCAACLWMDGKEFDLDEQMDSHVNCRCSPVPITKSWDELLGPLGIDASDIPDTRPELPTGEDWLANQDEATQRAVFGSNRLYELYAAGMPLSDFVKRTHDPEWGGSIQVRRLKELVK